MSDLDQSAAGVSRPEGARKCGQSADEEAPVERNTAGLPPLSFGQRQVWLHAQLAPDLPLYNEVVTIHKSGPLDVAALERAFNEIVRRHEAWRTTFPLADGQPVQMVHPATQFQLPVLDLRHLPEAERAPEALRIATAEALKPFDLARGPLLRPRLVRLSDSEHRLFVILHHLIFDGVTVYGIFPSELMTLYAAFVAGKPSPLPEPAFQYAEYVDWQQGARDEKRFSQQMEYWRKHLAGELPALQLPTDGPRPATQTYRGAAQPFELSKDLTEALKALGRGERVSLFVTLFAAFNVLLHRYTGQDDILVGSATAGRSHTKLENVMGYFLNTVVLRNNLAGNPTFRALLGEVRGVTLDALAHDEVPYERLVKELLPKRDLTRNPLFQAFFSIQPPLAALDSGWSVSQMEVDTGITKYDLYLEMEERFEGIVGRFTYNTNLFHATTIERMAGHWQTLLAGIVADPERRLAELPLLTDGEREELLVTWNQTSAEYPRSECIHQLFEAQAKRTPESVALVYERDQLTYRELNERANRLARRLRKRGVGPEVLVGICIERSPEMVVALLGILKAGGAYVPLDPKYPRERLAFMVEDSGLKVLVTLKGVGEGLARPGVEAIFLDTDWEAISEESVENLAPRVAPDNLAYVIYTSGSTGKPKGVQISHRALVNFLISMRREPGIAARDTLLAVTTISFDIAALELYLPLIVGARVVIASREVAADGRFLQSELEKSGATIMQATPATWRLLLESGWHGNRDLKVLCGGETLPRDLADRLLEKSASVWNLYGPTETTVWSTLHRVQAGDGPVVIGRPIANTEIYVLGPGLEPSPVGIAGELFIGGDGLARGYLNRPTLTAERFIAHPFCEGRRLYKTGDLARYRGDGTIEHLGRVDHQLKIRGFRIEPGEIEALLVQDANVREAVVVAREETPGTARLVAYWVPRKLSALSSVELRSFLREKLPEYMIPSTFVALDTLPRTPNGKIDRGALPMAQAQPERDNGFLAPRDGLETQLAQLWENLLGVKPVGVKDSFFDLGGHSLLAARLFARMEKIFGRAIPLSTLFKAPTIEKLAAILREQGVPAAWSSIVPIQPSGTRPPLFCVHGHSGEVLFYRELSQRLGPDQPLFALQARGLTGTPPDETIEAMASHYVREMRSVQPQGPYWIGGYCLGGTIAFEMAQQLHEQGQEVALLALFDSALLAYLERRPFHWLSYCAERAQFHLGKLWSLRGKERLAYIWEKARGAGQTLLDAATKGIWRVAFLLYGGVQRPLPRRLQNVPEINLQAARRYEACVYPGRVALFMSEEKLKGFSSDPRLAWRRFAGGRFEVRQVLGDSESMFQEPFVGALARELQACLDGCAVEPRSSESDAIPDLEPLVPTAV